MREGDDDIDFPLQNNRGNKKMNLSCEKVKQCELEGAKANEKVEREKSFQIEGETFHRFEQISQA